MSLLHLKRLAQNFQQGRLGRDAVLQVVNVFVVTVSRMAVLLVAAPLFGPALWGLLNLFLNSLTFLGRMGDGLGGSLVRAVATARAGEEATALRLALRASVIFSFFMGVAAFLFVIGFSWWDAEFFVDHELAVFLTFALALASFGRLMFEYVFRGLRLYFSSMLIAVILAPLQAGAVLWLVFSGYRIHGYLAVLAVESALATAALAAVLLLRMRKTNAPPGPLPALLPIVAYSGPLILRGVVGFCTLRINIYLVKAASTDVEVGLYSFADRFLLVPMLLLGAYMAAIAPRIAEAIARKDTAGVAGLAQRSNGVTLLMMIPFAVGFVLCRPVFSIDFLREFAPAWRVLALFGLSLPILAISSVASAGLMVYSGRAHISLIPSTLAAMLNVALCLLLSRYYGAAGAGTAVLISFWAGGVAEVWIAYRMLHIPFRIRLPL